MLHSFLLKKMFLYILILICIPSNLHGLNCYSNKSFYFSINEFNWNNFSIILDNNNHQIITNTSSCHVKITVDYNHNNVFIKFHPIKNSSITYIEFGSIINFFQNQIQSIISYLDYTCSSGNLCDKIFLINWAKQLLNSSDNSLHNNFISLWDNSNICQKKLKTNYCESHLCFTIYNELKNLSYGKSQCEDKFSTNPININIKINSGNTNHQYQCMKNHCTRELIYNLTLENNSTKKLDINNKNEIIFKQTIIIVGVLLFIGSIAYYIQCRKYKQGYRLTRNA